MEPRPNESNGSSSRAVHTIQCTVNVAEILVSKDLPAYHALLPFSTLGAPRYDIEALSLCDNESE